MNKFKKWLIKKLGGEIRPPEIKIIKETVPVETIKTRMQVPDFDRLSFKPSDEEIIRQMRGEISKQVGEFLFDNGMLRIQRKFDIYDNCECIEASAKVIKEIGGAHTLLSGRTVSRQGDNYCPSCGQAILWEEEK